MLPSLSAHEWGPDPRGCAVQVRWIRHGATDAPCERRHGEGRGGGLHYPSRRRVAREHGLRPQARSPFLHTAHPDWGRFSRVFNFPDSSGS